jgi:phosphate uptake regulator
MIDDEKEAMAVVRALLTARTIYNKMLSDATDVLDKEDVDRATEDIETLTKVIVKLLGQDPDVQ